MEESFEDVIISNLINNSRYCTEVLPYIKHEYFSTREKSIIVKEILDFYNKYNKSPTTDILKINFQNNKNIHEKLYTELKEYLDNVTYKKLNYKWLYETSENFCQRRASWNAIKEGWGIYKGTINKSLDVVPEIMRKACMVKFDDKLGHAHKEEEDGKIRYQFHHRRLDKISFNIDKMNRITRGGLENKTISVVIAGSNVGKSAFLCNFAAHNLMQGKNIVYFTMEMAEEMIGERIDANTMGIPIEQLRMINEKAFLSRLKKIREKTAGHLIIKEYPSGRGNALMFRNFIKELEFKKNILPDAIVVDHLNICSPIGKFNSYDTYNYMKDVIVELRAIAQDLDVPVLTAAQTTKEGGKSMDPDMADVGESKAIPDNCDRMWGLATCKSLRGQNRIMVKELKDRYGEVEQNSFELGVDYSRSYFFDLPSQPQQP